MSVQNAYGTINPAFKECRRRRTAVRAVEKRADGEKEGEQKDLLH